MAMLQRAGVLMPSVSVVSPKLSLFPLYRVRGQILRVHRDVNAARNVLKRAVAGPWSGFARQNNGLASGRRSGNL
jgi:hypothetical protein